ncbi:MAG: nuclear transport factor 2 family protein [Pseudomonadota bacterium]
MTKRDVVVLKLHRTERRWRLCISALLSVILFGCGEQTTTEEQGDSEQMPVVEHSTESSDKNLAEALLYRWWGIFEAPDDVDVTPFFDELFSADVYLAMPGVELSGDEAIRTAFASLPPDNGRSHQLINVTVRPLTATNFQLDAAFTYQIARPDGSIDAGYSRYRHEMIKQSDGSFRIANLTADLGDSLAIDVFEPSYATNRARGTLVQYLGITDLLHSDYAPLQQVFSDRSEVIGMFDPLVETHNVRGDGILRGVDEIRAWLSTRRDHYQWVSHKLSQFEVESVGDRTYRATAMVAVQAQPIDGPLVDVALPIELSFEDNDGRFMVITRIER